jgi:hypothetical protein
VIAGLSPSSGQQNTRVTVVGTDLLSGADSLINATLGGVEAEVASVSVSSVNSDAFIIVLIADAGITAGLGDVVLSSSNGATVSLENGWEYVSVPSITDVSPSTGHGSTVVSISGTGLLSGAESISTVTLNGASVSSIEFQNDTLVTVIASIATAGTGDVVMTAVTGATVTATDGFTYVVPGEIESIEPASGQLGTSVTITGSNLFAAAESVTEVLLGSTAASEISSQNNTHLVVVAASASATSSAVDVQITAASGAIVTGSSLWTQLADGSIDEVSPATGQVGTRVSLSGARLLGGTDDLSSVSLAGVAASYEAGTANNTDVVVVIVTAGSAGVAGDVQITAATGALITSSGAFTYLAA